MTRSCPVLLASGAFSEERGVRVAAPLVTIPAEGRALHARGDIREPRGA